MIDQWQPLWPQSCSNSPQLLGILGFFMPARPKKPLGAIEKRRPLGYNDPFVPGALNFDLDWY